MALTLTNADDLAPFAEIDDAKAALMIADALARAALIAPCINDDDFAYEAAAKAIIRGAILRWHDSGSGALTQESETTGPFATSKTVDTRQGERRSLFWPSEINDLERLCKAFTGAYAVDTAPGAGDAHSETCSLRFGADYCSCGVDVAGYPIYEILP